ncbi:uncharacterized protein LOC113565205 [Drosophila persimilis]|uniref:Uncharacterized protein, isoform A n=1 Tax=Drosophila pseudoobscura pseudoobscura TaxID=46245 RepID=A0A0R3P1E4_DROPS|nr:uncharacterized protein LOC26534410 [Drosophila pseudoobscura]XP_026842485.1 uncharacterized protein LOC113565205 [Drosophila persimilis]
MPRRLLPEDGQRPSKSLILVIFAMAILMKAGIIVVELML